VHRFWLVPRAHSETIVANQLRRRFEKRGHEFLLELLIAARNLRQILLIDLIFSKTHRILDFRM
jgi:hypothetical protein